MPLLCHRAAGLTRGYWRSTDAPVETSTVLPRDDVMREANDVASVTQVSDIPDGGDAGKRPVSGVDGGLLGPARRRGQYPRGSFPGRLFDNYPPFPSTTIRPKRGNIKNIYVSLSYMPVQCLTFQKCFSS